MCALDSFPDRFKLRKAQPVTNREEAPATVRYGIYSLVSAAGLKPFRLRRVLCRRLLLKENTQVVDGHRILAEVEEMLAKCHWYEVYALIEDVYTELLATQQLRPDFAGLNWPHLME